MIKKTILFFIFLAFISIQGKEVISKFVKKNDRIELNCEKYWKKGDDITWLDYVHNENHDPLIIYSTIKNLKFDKINDGLFLKDETLIVDTSFENYGDYTCRISRDNNQTDFNFAVLQIGDKGVMCKKPNGLITSPTFEISCEMKAQGVLEWIPKFPEISNATERIEGDFEPQSIVSLLSKSELDKSEYVCKVKNNDQKEYSCKVFLEIAYPPKNIIIEEKTYYPGDQIQCVAMGNPNPAIRLTLNDSQSADGVGVAKILITEEMMDKEFEAICLARNNYNNKENIVDKKFNFNVKESPQTAASSDQQNLIIIIIVVLLLLLLLIIIALIFIIARRKKKQERKTESTLLSKKKIERA